MGTLHNLRQRKKIELGDGEWIEVWQELTAGDMEEILRVTEGGKTTSILIVLEKIIAGWSYTDERGNTLPLTRENIAQLPTRIVERIMQEVQLATSNAFLQQKSDNAGA